MGNSELESKGAGVAVGVLVADLIGSPHEGFDIITSTKQNELFASFDPTDPNKTWMSGIIELIDTVQSNGRWISEYIGHLGTGFWKYGETTDDTAQNGLLLESFVGRDGYDLHDIANRFLVWFDHGMARGLGGTSLMALHLLDPLYTEPPVSPLDSGRLARERSPIDIKLAHADRAYTNHAVPANGGTMRAPAMGVPRFLREDFDLLRHVVAEVTNVTHAFDECVATSQIVAELIARFINGETRSEAIDEIADTYREHFERSLLSIDVDSGHTGGTYESTGIALRALMTTDTFRDAVEYAINAPSSVRPWANDTDTYGAIVGGMAGALYGYESIPASWQTPIHPETGETVNLTPRSAAYMKALGAKAVNV